MASTTVPGTGGSTVTVSNSNVVAQQIANAIAAVTTSGGTLSVTSFGIGTPPPSAPPPGTVGEIIITGSVGGGATIPAGYSFIVDNASAPVTITAGNNQSVLLNTVAASVFGTGNNTVAAGGGNDLVVL